MFLMVDELIEGSPALQNASAVLAVSISCYQKIIIGIEGTNAVTFMIQPMNSNASRPSSVMRVAMIE